MTWLARLLDLVANLLPGGPLAGQHDRDPETREWTEAERAALLAHFYF